MAPNYGSWERRLWEDFTGNGTRSPTSSLGTDNAVGDAFGRVRVADPVTIFDSQLQYDKQPLLWDEKIVGSSASTHLPNESAVDMAVTTADGDSVIRQTRDYHRYQPGKSQFILCTFVLGSPQDGTTKLVGYGDGNNGIFVGQDGGGTFVLLRSSNTGTASDARKVYQQDWNLDTLLGNGPSGLTTDWTKTQISVTDLEWLGVGRVRVGFNINGVTVYAHEFLNANIQDKVYMTTANLPVRYEITNSQAVASSQTLKQICCSVISEGGIDETAAYPFSVELVDVSVPNGAVNAIVIFAARVVTQILYNPTITGGTWATPDPSSGIEGNSTATAFSGGINIGSSVIAGGTRGSSTPVFGKTVTSRLPFGLGIDADDPITLALVAYATDANVSASFTFQWEELR